MWPFSKKERIPVIEEEVEDSPPPTQEEIDDALQSLADDALVAADGQVVFLGVPGPPCPRFHLTVSACCCVSCPAKGTCTLEKSFANVCDPDKFDAPKWIQTCSAKKAKKGEYDEDKEGEACGCPDNESGECGCSGHNFIIEGLPD